MKKKTEYTKKCSTRKACRIIDRFLDDENIRGGKWGFYDNSILEFLGCEDDNEYKKELRKSIRQREIGLKRDINDLLSMYQEEDKLSAMWPKPTPPPISIIEQEHFICIRLAALYREKETLEKIKIKNGS